MKPTIRARGEINFQLKRAILLYESNDSRIFPTLHQVYKKEGESYLREAELLDTISVEKVVRAISGLPTQKCFFPDYLLNWENSSMVWYCSPKRRPIFYMTKDSEFDNAFPDEIYHLPLIFRVDCSGIYVWALKDRERPTPETRIFQAPYYNIYESGHMCRGDVSFPEKIHPSKIPEWESAFFGTRFTHTPLEPKQITSYTRGFKGFWKDLAKWDHMFAYWKFLVETGDKQPKTVMDVILQGEQDALF